MLKRIQNFLKLDKHVETTIAPESAGRPFSFPLNKAKGTLTVHLPDTMTAYDCEESIAPDLAKRFKNVSCTGKKSRVFLGENVNGSKAKIALNGNGNTLIIGSNTLISGLIVLKGHNLTVSIGAGTTFNHVEIFCKGKANGVYIGRDCMFSSNIEIRTSDAHSIIDLDTMERTNHPDGVFIGDHVWLSKHATVQKGAVIGDDNIVGFGALVNRNFDITNAVLVGTPAKPLPNRRVTWSRKGNIDRATEETFAWKQLPYF